jgi:hypothetical protein
MGFIASEVLVAHGAIAYPCTRFSEIDLRLCSRTSRRLRRLYRADRRPLPVRLADVVASTRFVRRQAVFPMHLPPLYVRRPLRHASLTQPSRSEPGPTQGRTSPVGGP